MPTSRITLPITYQTLAIDQPGMPIALRQKTLSSLKKDEVLVRVDYASINSMDVGMARSNAWNLPTPYVLGFDFSGEVVLAGRSGKFQIGDQVFGNSLGAGGFAEYVVAKTLFLGHRHGIPAVEASTYGIAFMSSYEAVMLAGRITSGKGKWIYVAGAAGGVGHFAAQMAKFSGLKVIGSAGKAASLDLLRRIGVDHVIDYKRQDVVEEILRLTGGKGVDFVYDPTYNQASYEQSAAVIASGGTYIRLGTQAHMQRSGLEDMTSTVKQRGAKFVVGDQVRYGSNPWYMVQALKLFGGLKKAVTWYDEGKVKPVVTQIVPFDPDALQAALTDFSKGINNVGKVVVQCGNLGLELAGGRV